ncbi:cupin domain-containing protein [Pseudomonas alloputida]|uniref:Cupin domain-containing protein n=1 Tax=Pseudomonas alloputida TaxID=1940621 RepID=A0ABY3D5X5_9PSED|nr:cupin domain-containing protein [Pseudomonas alloputida]TRZ60993.1 cupin domain-containing protein [Pseudomonas alloputida]
MSVIRITLENNDQFGEPVTLGSATDPTPQARIAANLELNDGRGSTGIWECTPGRFRRQVAQAEYSYIVSGAGSFTPNGAEPVHFSAGDALYFEANSQGTWDILETVRKTYLILN